MGKPDGFLQYHRELPEKRDPDQRKQDFKEIYLPFAETKTREQAARCMDCGVPFCHKGCPLGNNIPAFNDAVNQGDWALAFELLYATNNFPEFTGRICPAPCESSCVLGINQPPVTIELIEKSIAEQAFEAGLVKPRIPKSRTGKNVAVIGAGPAGMAAADQLNQAGHTVTVFERDAQPGGLLRYGVPDFKLEKWVVERRITLMEAEGISFQCNTEVGKDISGEALQAQYDAIVLCVGAMVPRDMPIEGRDLTGIHFAMDYLAHQNKQVGGELLVLDPALDAHAKHVIVLGGGDTGSDCIGTANRQEAASITQITWGNKPPSSRTEDNPWPEWPMVLQTSTSHEEGCERAWNILTKAFVDDGKGHIKALRTVQIEWTEGRKSYQEIPGTEEDLPCDMALIAVGFVHPQKEGLLQQLGVELGRRGNVQANRFQTTVPGVFAAGDAHRGASLVVWAIAEGREAAREADIYLMGRSQLPSNYQARWTVDREEQA